MQKRKKKLLSGNEHELLYVKMELDIMITDVPGLPAKVKEPLILARDAAWELFVAGQEKVNQTTR